MARTAQGRFSVSANIQETATALGVGDGIAHYNHRLDFAADLANGVSDGQIDRCHTTSGTVAAGTPVDFDLAGALPGMLNSTTNVFVEMTTLVVRNTTAAGGGNLIIGADAAPIALFLAGNDAIILPPGGVFAWYAPQGIAITGGASDVLQLASSSGNVTFQMLIAGRSA